MNDETMIPMSALRAALKMRAVAYAHMFDVMREHLGEEKAQEIGQEATRRLGQDMGPNFAKFAPNDLNIKKPYGSHSFAIVADYISR